MKHDTRTLIILAVIALPLLAYLIPTFLLPLATLNTEFNAALEAMDHIGSFLAGISALIAVYSWGRNLARQKTQELHIEFAKNLYSLMQRIKSTHASLVANRFDFHATYRGCSATQVKTVATPYPAQFALPTDATDASEAVTIYLSNEKYAKELSELDKTYNSLVKSLLNLANEADSAIQDLTMLGQEPAPEKLSEIILDPLHEGYGKKLYETLMNHPQPLTGMEELYQETIKSKLGITGELKPIIERFETEVRSRVRLAISAKSI